MFRIVPTENLSWSYLSKASPIALSKQDIAPKSAVPSIASAFLSTFGKVLCIAPKSDEWALSAPDNVRFLPPNISHDLIDHIRHEKPLAIIVADQIVNEEIIKAWRVACPSDKLVLVRRGTSLDKIDIEACKRNGIRVINTPGVNAPHVADYIVAKLVDKDGELPRGIRLLGCGDVGKEVVKKINHVDPKCGLTIFVRGNKTPADLGLSQYQEKLTIVSDWDAAFNGANAVIVSVSTNKETTARISKKHIDSLKENGRIVCVSKPDVLSDEALITLAQRKDLELVIDYGPATLDAFQSRLGKLGIPIDSWKKRPQLTTKAAVSEKCKRDLDYAVAVRLAIVAIDRFVSHKLSDSFKIPILPPPFHAPSAHVVGCGINGLFQALMLRLAGYQVCIHGGRDETDGASHKNINMRHLSATETTAKPVHNSHLFPANNDLMIRMNLGSIELFRKFLEDNPTFAQFAQEDLIRAYPASEGDPDKGINLQRELSKQEWPSGKKGNGFTELTPQAFKDIYKIPGIAKVIKVPGYDLEFRKFMDALFQALEKAGIKFNNKCLTPDELSKLGFSGHPVVTAMGVADQDVIPIVGWFVKLRSVDGEGEGIRGMKFQYELPVGVMNCRRDDEFILISGGQVPDGSTPEETEQIKLKVLEAVARHFPKSYGVAEKDGQLELTMCARPGVKDGLSRVQQTGPRQIRVSGTYAGGMTQSTLLAKLVQDKILRESRDFLPDVPEVD